MKIVEAIRLYTDSLHESISERWERTVTWANSSLPITNIVNEYMLFQPPSAVLSLRSVMLEFEAVYNRMAST